MPPTRSSAMAAAASAADAAGAVPGGHGADFDAELEPTGVLRIAVRGDLGEDDARRLLDRVQDLVERSAEPHRFLVDARRSGAHARGARVLLAQTDLRAGPGYLAVVGAPWWKRWFIRVATHNRLLRELRFFAREDDARAWLMRAGRPPGTPPA